MPVSSFYERDRDGYRTPTCWRVRDNFCAPHFHGALEIAYLHSGGVDALIDGEQWQAGAGDLVVVPGYAVHRFSTPTASDSTVLVLPMDYIRSFGELMRGKRFATPLVKKGAATAEIARCLETILNRQGPNGDMWPQSGEESYILRGQIYTVVGLLLETVPLTHQHRETSHGQVQEILAYLHKNFRQPLPLPVIAAALGYSESRLSHLFNSSVGCSIPEYLGSLRSRAAATILLEETASVTDAAMEAGFESMRTFYRAFQNSFGVTPSQLRKLPQAELRALMQGELSSTGQNRV